MTQDLTRAEIEAILKMPIFEAVAWVPQAIAQLLRQLDAANASLDGLKKAIEVKGGNEHAPTQWAYDQACAAIEKHHARADAAGAAHPVTVEVLRGWEDAARSVGSSYLNSVADSIRAVIAQMRGEK